MSYRFIKNDQGINSNGGFIALITAIVISILLISITFTLSFASFFGRFNILSSEFKEKSSGLAEACVDVALLKLANDPSYGPMAGGDIVMIGSDSCKIISVQQGTPVAGQLTIKTQAVFHDSYTNIKVVANSSNLSIVSWEEVPVLP
jgi:hypothetical protein